jgi:hypothetical protein
MPKWDEITRTEKYQNLPPEAQAQVKTEWFKANLLPEIENRPSLKEMGPDKVYEWFMQQPDDTGQGYVTSLLGSAARGFGEVVPGAVEGVGAITGIEGLREAGQGIRSSLESITPVNPLYQQEVPMQLAGVGGQIGSVLATGGVGGALGKALGGVNAVSRGAQGALLGSAFLQGAAEGRREAEQYGMEGPEAYLRGLTGGAIEAGTEFLPFGMAAETAVAKRMLAGAPKTSSFLGAAGSEFGEEGLGKIASNIATQTLAPTGVETPGIMEGALENALYGAAGGAMLGGINALIPSAPKSPEIQIAAEALNATTDTPFTDISGQAAADTIAQNTELAMRMPVQPVEAAEEIAPEVISNEALLKRAESYRRFLAANPGYVGVEKDLMDLEAELQRRQTTPVANQANFEERNQNMLPDTDNFGGKFEKPLQIDPNSYTNSNGIETVNYINPDNGLVDVYISAFGNNDFIAYMRQYDENGAPTNRWTSKLERRTAKAGATKAMLRELQSRLPQGHQYTEDVSVSTDGLRFFTNQLQQGYEVARNPDGTPQTTEVAISGESITNDLPISVDPNGKFENIRVSTPKEFAKVRDHLAKMLEKFGVGLNEKNVRWENGTVFIDLPVLNKKSQPDNVVEKNQVTPSPEMEMLEKPSQTITGSNGEIAPEMPVPVESTVTSPGEAPPSLPEAGPPVVDNEAPTGTPVQAAPIQPVETQEDAVQEQIPDEGVLRQERPEMELQGVGEGNAQPEKVAETRSEEVKRKLRQPYASIAVPDLEKVSTQDWMGRRDYLEGKLRNNQQERTELLKTPKQNWESREYNESAKINEVAASLRAAIQDMQLARPDLEAEFRAKSGTKTESRGGAEIIRRAKGEMGPAAVDVGGANGELRRESETLQRVSEQPKITEISGRSRGDDLLARDTSSNVVASNAQKFAANIRAQFKADELAEKAEKLKEKYYSINASTGKRESESKDRTLQQWKQAEAKAKKAKADAFAELRKQNKGFTVAQLEDREPFMAAKTLEQHGLTNLATDKGYVKQGDLYVFQPPSPPTTGAVPTKTLPAGQKVTPGGVATERDLTKVEQMTPEEYASSERDPELPKNYVLSDGNGNFVTEEKNGWFKVWRLTGTHATLAGTVGFKGAEGLAKAKARLKEVSAEMHEEKLQNGLRTKKPVSKAAVDTYGITLPEGYVKQGDLYVFQPQTKAAETQTPVLLRKGTGEGEAQEEEEASTINTSTGATSSQQENIDLIKSDLALAEEYYREAKSKSDSALDEFYSVRNQFDTRKNPPRNFTYRGPKSESDRILKLAQAAHDASVKVNLAARDVGKLKASLDKVKSSSLLQKAITGEPTPQTKAAETQTPESVAVDSGAAGVVQSEPSRGSILEVEKESTKTAIRVNE